MQMGSRQFGSSLELDYLMVPINANWHFGSTRKWFLNFGISPGILGVTIIVDESEEGFSNTNAGSSLNVGAVFKL